MYIVWINDFEFVGYIDRRDAEYAATGRKSLAMNGVSSLADYVRDGGDSDDKYDVVEIKNSTIKTAIIGKKLGGHDE